MVTQWVKMVWLNPKIWQTAECNGDNAFQSHCLDDKINTVIDIRQLSETEHSKCERAQRENCK